MFLFYVFIELMYISNLGIFVSWLQDTLVVLSELTFSKKERFFYHLSTPFIVHQYYEEGFNLICCQLLHPFRYCLPFKFTLFRLSCSWVSAGANVPRVPLSQSPIRRSLGQLLTSQPPGRKEDLQVGPDEDVSLKEGGVVWSEHSWGGLEAVTHGRGQN